jgi:hypothetical protein
VALMLVDSLRMRKSEPAAPPLAESPNP